MASNTENLDLLMKNPSTDGADTFNVQTMLNENWQKIDNNAGTVAQTLANILKPTTPPIIGLPSSATPDDMFNVLAHAGDLHVWRKTVVTKEPIPEVPGSYTLGSAAITNLARMTSNGYNGYAANILVSKEIKANLDGSVELVSPISRQMIVAGSSDRYTIDVNSDDLLGAGNRYFTPSEDSDSNSSRCTLLIPPGTVYYVAPGTTYTTAARSIGFTSAFNAAQLVTGVPGTPAIPAGTTVTYPVSTNRNAYQEGNDAKPAWYTLGEVVTGDYRFVNDSSATVTIYYANAPIVSDDGRTVDIAKTNSIPIQAAYDVSNIETIKGKYIQIADGQKDYAGTPFNDGRVYYIPSNATFSMSSGLYAATDRYQPVTGYAAIPANTTIEYLGCLGDKARVQVVSYVGTGTYGKDSKNQLTFSGKPRFIMVPGDAFGYAYIPKGMFYYVIAGNYATLEDLHCVWDDDTNIMTWYHPSYPYRQYNQSGTKYTFVAIY